MKKQDLMKLQVHSRPLFHLHNSHLINSMQTCVNIQCACQGCNHKIKKLLDKIDGVHKTSIDLEQGKVTVYGNADPATLIKKLNKSGKHAELWGPQNNQLKNHKGDSEKDEQKGQRQMQATINKGFKDIKLSNKDQKSVKFNLPVGGGGGGGFDGQDDFDEEFDNEDGDGFEYKKPNKMMTGPGVGGHGPNGPIGMMNGKKGPSSGFELTTELGKGGNNDAKKGNGGKKGGSGGDSDSKSGKKSKEGGGRFGGIFGGKIGRAFFGGGKKKHGKSKPKDGEKGGDGGGDGQKKGGSCDEKEGKHHDEGKFSSSDKQSEFLEFSKPQNGGGGRNMGPNGGKSGQNIGPMGGNPKMAQMGNYPQGQMPSEQGLPMAYQGEGVDHGNSYNQRYQQQYQQQQYTQAMMMNQHKANMYPQMMYGPAAYGRTCER
ncbi:hypothetical protein L1987_74504 [Smallanthus sonchifolius]|uniref:Uncharacterized protein n=1 Tax=Smallanthus sonchifolius TaxID=185202 RepID=A0ACB9A390_9ASTR|nr:hypothetical protein L1987_74504 [Smallanthus sonchifolius]